MQKPVLILLLSVVMSLTTMVATKAQSVTSPQSSGSGSRGVEFEAKTLPIISSGVVVPSDGTATDAKRWNQLVLLAKPKIHSGDIGAMSASIRKSATQCALTLLATIGKERVGNKRRFSLLEVGLGYSVTIQGQATIVTSETSGELGASLGFIGRQILSKNQAALSEVRLVARTKTLQIFDAPSIVMLDGTHQKCITRHLIWIDPVIGNGAMLAWLLRKSNDDPTKSLTVINKPLRLVRLGTKETRLVHVDEGQFTFGFPGELAVALEDLPPGTDVAWTNASKQIAANDRYSPKEIFELSAAFNDAIAQQRKR